jgi:hypothetical protein
MSQGKRIARGFARLGIWAAVMAVIVGVGGTGIWAVVQYSDTGLKGIDATGIGIGLALTTLAATAAFVFFRGIGWIIAGFLDD